MHKGVMCAHPHASEIQCLPSTAYDMGSRTGKYLWQCLQQRDLSSTSPPALLLQKVLRLV